jgi:lactam utilization protein B
MKMDDEELEAVITYQIGAIIAYAKTFDLEIESIRCHGALKNELNENENCAIVIANTIKKINPWLNLVVNNENTKNIVENQGVKAALEYEFGENDDINLISEKYDTIHFRNLEDIKKAQKITKPTPVNYNRVQNQI